MFLHYKKARTIILKFLAFLLLYKEVKMIIGIFGGSGCGKSTISRALADILPNSLLINGDIFMH